MENTTNGSTRVFALVFALVFSCFLVHFVHRVAETN